MQGGNLMFAADCPTKRAAFMTDMTPGRWSHVPAKFQTWDEAQPKNLHVVLLKISVFCIRTFLWTIWTTGLHDRRHHRRRLMGFRQFSPTTSPMILFGYSGNPSPKPCLFYSLGLSIFGSVQTLWNLDWTLLDNIGCSSSFSRSTTRVSTVNLMV